jgi:hypothetical protein
MVALLLYDSPIRRKEGDRLWVSLQANVIETLICGLLTCAQNKKDIFWVQIVKYENLCKG